MIHFKRSADAEVCAFVAERDKLLAKHRRKLNALNTQVATIEVTIRATLVHRENQLRVVDAWQTANQCAPADAITDKSNLAEMYHHDLVEQYETLLGLLSQKLSILEDLSATAQRRLSKRLRRVSMTQESFHITLLGAQEDAWNNTVQLRETWLSHMEQHLTLEEVQHDYSIFQTETAKTHAGNHHGRTAGGDIALAGTSIGNATSTL